MAAPAVMMMTMMIVVRFAQFSRHREAPDESLTAIRRAGMRQFRRITYARYASIMLIYAYRAW